MTRDGIVVVFAGWEERFLKGLERDLEDQRLGTVIMYWYDEYGKRTAENRKAIEDLCKDRGVRLVPTHLRVSDPSCTWKMVTESVGDSARQCGYVLVDTSTMPREIIWYVLWRLDDCFDGEARYVYHSPAEYADGWLSRDPRPPRFVYKLSGIALPSLKTALLVTVGFDPQRVARLIRWFEPSMLLVGVQEDSKYPRNSSEMEDYRDKFRGEYGRNHCTVFELDAYSEDRGMSNMLEQLNRLGDAYNTILASLGPRLSAISSYRIKRQSESIGLVYAPSSQYSDYSSGIGQSYSGTWR